MSAIDDVLQDAVVPAVAADQDGIITAVNAPFERVFGWSRAEIVGRPLTTIIPRSLRDAHNLGFSRFLTTQRPTLLDRPLRLKTIDKNGREFDGEHRILAERRGAGWIFAASIRPVE